ncbi:hypothetical protein UMM65_15140 [Aureibaculum sp. 2210JD6-5]|uniref:hypothetical protein n=1 Tax=Aureibaculum sp. 2210JD6-5 TaxID=3103957 RepID=UPI002AAE4499|nr:hypothetical protein [Aureibaculum sp. 2210JD6-5]MDY7396585.1 hypothetical protein [Aureibaculum sp. 2210JD6-5]
MKINGLILTFPIELKLLIGAFLIVLSVGFYTGLLFVNETSTVQPNGIEENYLGNEDVEDAEVMKFKKSPKEMLSIVHSHILSMSLIFFLLGLILSITKLSKKIKLFLMIEPFFSVLFTFGGLYLLWKEMLWMKYVVMFSGTLMTLSFTVSVLIIFSQLVRKQN